MTLHLSGDQATTFSAAKDLDRNILARLQRYGATGRMCNDLWLNRSTIEEVTAGHLELTDPSACTVQEKNTWIIGQFNVCVLVRTVGVDGKASTKIFRCPMEHKVGERYFPGAVDEKLRAEAAAYAWIEENCPEIPIPRLFGFGFSNKMQFTHRNPGLGFVQYKHSSHPNHPYMLLDFVESGTLLSNTLAQSRQDGSRMHNLIKGLSRIMLSLARKPQSCIGSLCFNDDASVTLTSRPLFCAHSLLESEGTPRTTDRTYVDSMSFVHDMLRFREQVLLAQPNAVYEEDDCRLQMSHLILLRSNMLRFVNNDQQGPFVLQFTDLNPSNIFVDNEWNIVAFIDLEFVCALPPDMLSVPYWLSVDKAFPRATF